MGRKLSFRAITLISCVIGFLAIQANAFTPTVSPNGISVRWGAEVKLNVVGNPGNRSGLSEQNVFSAIVRGLQRWSAASGGAIRFDYWQGSDTSVYEPNSEYNGLSSFYFASNSNRALSLSPNVLGLTQVWYNTETGEILETDTVLNDRDFYFTTNSTDTSGYGSSGRAYSGTKSKVFVENVITHELGHAVGLSHGGHLQSTMLFTESPEQAHLACDELTAAAALYPAADSGARGSIRGTVVSESGAPVYGAHVMAISRRRGAVIGSSLTDNNGNYAISALEPGTYFLMTEPFFAGAQVLPAFYVNINTSFCPGSRPFGRSFLTYQLADESGFSLRPITVSGGGAISQAPALAARCTQGGAAVTGSYSSSNISTALTIYENGNGFGAVDRFFASSTGYYRLAAVSGDLEVRVLSYSLYSPIRATVTLLDSSGRQVSAQIADRVYSGESGFVNYDTALIASGLPRGDYYIKLTAGAVGSSLYPAGPVQLDSVPFVVITGSLNESAPPLSGALPFNARCRMDENFQAYSSPQGDPPRHSMGSGNGDVGFCGTLNPGNPGNNGNNGDEGDSGSDVDPAAVAGWTLPWLFMLFSARLLRRSRLALVTSSG